MVIAIVIEIGSEHHPFLIGRKGWTLTIPSPRCQLAGIRAIVIHDVDFMVPRWTRVCDNGLSIRRPITAAADGGQVGHLMQIAAIPVDNKQLRRAFGTRGKQDLFSIRRPGGVPTGNLRNVTGVFAVSIHDHELITATAGVSPGKNNGGSIW